MSAQFFDLRLAKNPEDGTILSDGAMARTFLSKIIAPEPFIADLLSDRKTKLTFGIGTDICCAQFSNADDEPPYLMAKLVSESMHNGVADFRMGNELTEVERRLCLPLAVLLDVAAYFVETGERSPLVTWEAV